jgi:2-polyprenyl-3-methyl-5-hydroxy-6-metoxy-1,4-benzoquinol methylase
MTRCALVTQICQHYEVGAGFAAAYLRYLDAQADSLYELAALPEPIPAWFDYAMNTNRRGEAWLNWLLPHLPVDAHRCLALECGMGGLLVALARRGFRAFGFAEEIEIVKLARANCHDHGLLASVFTGNPLICDLIHDEYQFDLIVMLDGAAAAANAHQLIAFAAGRLRSGGLLVFNAPNPNSIAHFDASAALHPLGYYIQLCAHYGGTCEAHNSPTSYLRPVRDIDALLSQNGAAAHSTAFGSVWHEARRRSSLIDRLSRDYLDLPPDQFAERYLRDSWTLIARFA